MMRHDLVKKTEKELLFEKIYNLIIFNFYAKISNF